MQNLKLKLKDWYTIAAVGLLNGILLLVLLNLVLYAVMRARRPGPQMQDLTLDADSLRKAYPGWREEDIKTLLRETRMEERYEYEPFTEFRERPLRGKFVNIDPAGFRVSKDQAPWPPRADAINVFVFGGSTTFGVGLPDDQTITSYLQQFADADHSSPPLAIYNFAQPAYFSTQERIQFQRLLGDGYVPQVAVFIDGLNDFLFADGQPLFASRLRNFMAGKSEATGLSNIPMVQAAHWVGQRWSSPKVQSPMKRKDEAALLEGVVDRWLANKRIIELLAQGYGVRPLFVWQPVPTYNYDLQYHLFLQSHKDIQVRGSMWQYALRCRAGYPLMQEMRAQGKLGSNVLWLADLQQDKRQNLYVDHIHYNAEFSQEIAAEIYRFLRDGPKAAPASAHQSGP